MDNSELEKYVEKIYDEATPPLYLSLLGTILKNRYGYAGQNLFDSVNQLDNFCIVYKDGQKEKSAVARKGEEQKIKALLNNDKEDTELPEIRFLSVLPRTLLLAFCQSTDGEKQVFIQTKPPFHFFSSKRYEDMVEIENDLRIPSLIPYDVRKVPPDTAKRLVDNIKKWSKIKNIDLDQFKKFSPKKDTISPTLLERLISAIPEAKRKDMQISLEIVSILHGIR